MAELQAKHEATVGDLDSKSRRVDELEMREADGTMTQSALGEELACVRGEPHC